MHGQRKILALEFSDYFNSVFILSIPQGWRRGYDSDNNNATAPSCTSHKITTAGILKSFFKELPNLYPPPKA